MKTSDFDYHLPQELIAQTPAVRRDQSRLLLLERSTGETKHLKFKDLPDLLQYGDVLVLNDTKVIPARLQGNRQTGAGVEVFLLHSTENGYWRCLVNPGRKVRPGDRIFFNDELSAEIIDRNLDGTRNVKFIFDGDFQAILEKTGQVPLPPYIKRKILNPNDRERYQTIYAARAGAVAAPTAGLHFTKEILNTLGKRRIKLVYITLHVGLGTFKPVSADDIKDHQMEAEWYLISEKSAATINRSIEAGNRIVAVGTTVVRALESAWKLETDALESGSGWTNIFITPGYSFHVIDALLTNFHLPRSTLIMLVSAFADREKVLTAYEEAVRQKYRFYSYGDCMLIK